MIINKEVIDWEIPAISVFCSLACGMLARRKNMSRGSHMHKNKSPLISNYLILWPFLLSWKVRGLGGS
jgi:hypothetical protein